MAEFHLISQLYLYSTFCTGVVAQSAVKQVQVRTRKLKQWQLLCGKVKHLGVGALVLCMLLAHYL